jgi:hypothetical protein
MKERVRIAATMLMIPALLFACNPQRRVPSVAGPTPVRETRVGPAQGALVIVGGGEIGSDIINRFVRLAGGPREARIVVIPTAVDWRFSYGPDSFARHVAEAERLGLEVDVVEHAGLGWDVDHPEDLRPPPELGPPPWDLAELGAQRDG